jgi:GMP synthase-like glutamine amidotransferase
MVRRQVVMAIRGLAAGELMVLTIRGQVTRGYGGAVRALVIQHEPDGPAGHAGTRLQHHGYDLDVVRVLDGTSAESQVPFPDPTAYDLLLPLGSVHSVYDHGRIGSWIHRELDALRLAHESGVPVLGICFGCQSLAAALGGSVEAAPAPEIGWVTIDSDHPAITAGPWLAWHVDRVVLPEGASELARTDLCTQAWRLDRNVAVQFHPEVDADLLDRWVANAGSDYFPTKGVDPDTLLDGARLHGDRAREDCYALVDWFVEEVAAS